MCGGGMNNTIIQQADQMDIMQMIVREIIRHELKLKVERNPDVDANSFSVYLELSGEMIPNASVVVSLKGAIRHVIDFKVV